MFFSSFGSLGMSSAFKSFSIRSCSAAELGLFLARQVPHLGIFLQLARLGHARAQVADLAEGVDQLAEIGVLLRELLHLLAIGQHGRIGQHPIQLLVARLDAGELVEQQLIEQDGLGRRRRAAVPLPYFFWKRSMRPAASTNFCLPV